MVYFVGVWDGCNEKLLGPVHALLLILKSIGETLYNVKAGDFSCVNIVP